jgi:hypothetical protein
VEQVLAELAFSAHGLVKHPQLLRAGVSRAEIRTRLARGTLLPEYRGVYRVGHRAPTLESRYLAAVWACGDGAVLSGRPAAYLLHLIKGSVPPPEVTARTVRRVNGVITRRSCRWEADETMVWRRIPVTSVPRTLVDLARTSSVNELSRACHEAGVRFRTTATEVDVLLSRYPRAPGAGKLRTIFRGEARVSLSKLEERFLELLRDANLPLPVTNRPAGGRRVDCRWPDQRLTVELDSYRYHNSRQSWEADRRREREAYARGDAFRRYTWGDVFEEPALMLAELTPLLQSDA